MLFGTPGVILLLLAATHPVHNLPDNKIATMVRIPAGEFIMGSESAHPDDEGPQHAVFLKEYWIDRVETTNAQYRRCVTSAACSEPADLRFYDDPAMANHPVVFVTWYAARAYCRWRGKRLPAEAEWEKAARGGDGRRYPWGNAPLRDRLNADNRLAGTSPVGSYPWGASPYGLLDMAGNVWEWVDDWYEPYPGSTFRSDLFGRKYKVVRGGSWNHPSEDARTSHRDIASPARAMGVVGFRCGASAG
jgi:formylglycine-generating enzyme required for sulfatase activity